jgi:hypothetical protein
MKHQSSRSKAALRQRRHRFYALLLVATVLVIASFGLPFGLRRLAFIGNFLLSALLAIELGGALARPQRRRPADHLYRLLGLVNIAAQLLWLMAPRELRLVGLPLLIAFTLFIAWSLERLIHCLAKERQVGGRVVAGALAGYLLLGISGGLVLSVIDTLHPGSFVSSLSHHVLSLPAAMADAAAGLPVTRAWDLNFLSLNYFAFVSLTTVGYGDIIPVTPAAQMVSIGLSVAGPLYIAVVMGVLISRLTLQNDQVRDADQQDDAGS